LIRHRIAVVRPWLRGPLRSRNFRLLVMCNVISVSGSAVSFVAVPFAVLAIGGSASDVGYVATAGLIPLILFLLLGGVVADRLPRHQVLVAANALQALAQAAAATLILTGQARIWSLMALAAAGGIGTGLAYPASQGLLPQTVPADQRPQANALDRTGRNAASIGGSALGGLLVGAAGPGWALAIDAASFAMAGALRAGLRFPILPPGPASSMLHELREGWHEFISRRWLWVIAAQFAFLIAVSAGTVNVLGPLVTDSRLGGARSWGFIVAAYAAGAVIGGLIMIRYRPQRMLLAAISSVPAFSALLFALAVPLAVPLDIAAAFFAGGCLEVFGVSWATTLQQEIPAEKLSRVSSYDALGGYALTPVGTAIAGPLAAAFGTAAVLTAGGVLIVLLPLLVLLVPEVRHLRRRPPAPRPAPSWTDGRDTAGPDATPPRAA
jgi:MFS family permease